MIRWLAALLTALTTLLAPSTDLCAQSTDASTFLTPFPDGDRYRVQIWGDSMSAGLLEALKDAMAEETRFAIEPKHRWIGGLLKSNADEEVKSFEQKLGNPPPHIVVMMLGAQDRLAMRRGNKRAEVGSTDWKIEYARRLDLFMRTLKSRSIGLFWVSLPIMRREEANRDAEMMNEIFRSRALANGARYIDIFQSFATADNGYDAYGPDLAGKNRLIREPDGVHFTWHGSLKLAHFVEKEIKRAAQDAWDERTIPLAGSEAEQARIRPLSTVKVAPPGTVPASTRAGRSPARIASKAAGPNSPTTADSAAGGIAAQSSEIVLKSINAQGREETVKLEIVRPAIPPTVLALIKRRESEDKASQIGDAVMTEILGSMTVVSSVTPVAEVASDRRRNASLVYSPLSRVLQRGETLPPKPGRADEMPWPRPEPVVAKVTYMPLVPGQKRKATTPRAPEEAWPGGPSLPRRPSWTGNSR